MTKAMRTPSFLANPSLTCNDYLKLVEIVNFFNLLICNRLIKMVIFESEVRNVGKTVQMLDRVLSVASRPGRCPRMTCAGSRMRLLSAEGQRIAVPGSITCAPPLQLRPDVDAGAGPAASPHPPGRRG